MGRRQAADAALPRAESLVGRVDQLELRLRQLEERETRPVETYFKAAPNQECKAMPPAQVRLNGTLVDRLHLLETRIRQLTSELDKGSSGPGSSVTTSTIQPEKKKQNNTALSSSRVAGAPWRAGDIFHRGTRELQAHKSKAKDSKEIVEAMEKRMDAMCRDGKTTERTRFYKRWFPIGC